MADNKSRSASKEFTDKINAAIREENERSTKVNTLGGGSPYPSASSKTLNADQLNTLRKIALGEMDDYPATRAEFFKQIGVISNKESTAINAKKNTIPASTPEQDQAECDEMWSKMVTAQGDTRDTLNAFNVWKVNRQNDIPAAQDRRKRLFALLKETGMNQDEAVRLVVEYYNIVSGGANQSVANSVTSDGRGAGRWDPYARKWKQIG